MKRNFCNLWTLLAVLFLATTAGAQVSTYERTPGYYTLGINGGLAFQEADIPTTLEGYGVGLTLAKNLYYQPGSLLSFDLRGRALYSQTKGLDYFRSYGIQDNSTLNGDLNLDYTAAAGESGFVFQNNKTDHAELALEGVIHLNKLREATNVNVSLFGGIGIDWYKAQTDQANRQGLYTADYLGLDTLSSVSYIKRQLKNQILDGDYETSEKENGKIGFMPSLGVELGYQFTPRFSMGVGHKVTFTKTDLFDGHQWENNGDLTGDDDIHHYTNLHMRWIIDDNSKKLREPLVDITNPQMSPTTSRNPTYDIRATVKNISSAMDIEFRVNGYRETFNFRKNDFRSFIKLRPGNNDIVITATNQAGTASDRVTIFYEAPIIDTNPNYEYPTVEITNPPYNEYKTDEQRFTLRAQMRNVYSKRDIELTVNGREEDRFEYSQGSLRATLDLRTGRNEVRIGVRNTDGFASDETTIIFQDYTPSRPPAVNITKPSVDPYRTDRRSVTVEANVYNVTDKRDIQFIIDGYETQNFDFSNGVLYATVDVNDYKTLVEVKANNDAGQDADSATILWEEEEDEIDKPVVTITSMSQPTVDPFDPTNCRSTVIATITNVDDRNDIDFWLNGKHHTNYDFNPTTQVFQSTIRLEPGTNTIRIKASNRAGTDEDQKTVEGCNTQTDEEELPEVEITRPRRNNQTVSQASLNVVADVLNISSKNDITFKLNGQNILSFDYNKNTKVVSSNVTLSEGKNTIFIEVENQDGKDNDQLNVFYERPVLQLPPGVDIQRPRNNTSVSNAKVQLVAQLKNITAQNQIEVYVNRNRIRYIDFDKKSQKVVATLTLDEGKNTIRVVASNDSGTDEDRVNVTYTAPKPVRLPTVRITRPRDNSTAEGSTERIAASLRNIVSRSQITFLVNGKKSNTFNYQRGSFTADVKLEAGRNTIIVKARNDDGSAEDKVTINYRIPVNPPKVTITSPRTDKNFTQSKVILSANIEGVNTKREVSLTVNGRAQRFSYTRGKLSASITLSEGRNTVRVKATNAGGSDEASIRLNYNKLIQAAKPTIRYTNPAKPGAIAKKAKYTIRATVKNVDRKEDIKIKLNGRKLNSFSFDSRTKEVSVNVNLKNGKNNIEIEAKNATGRVTEKSFITYKSVLVAKNPPKVTINSVSTPAVDPFNPDKGKSTVIAKITNVRSKRDIKFEFNGKSISNFSFNTRTGILQITLDLKKGTNTFSIKATNGDGQDQASRNIQFGSSTNSGGSASRNDHKKNNKGNTGGVSRRSGH